MSLYDVAYSKVMPEDMVQHNGISQSSCDSIGVLYNSHEGGDHMKLGEEKKGYAAVSQNPLPPNAVKDRDEIQNTLNSKLYQSTGDINKLHEERPLCTSMKAVKDPSLHLESQEPLPVGESMSKDSSGSYGSPENVVEKEEVESNSHPKGGFPSPTRLAQVNKIDEAHPRVT
ncbi:hypothetical protein Cadr_000023456 [Camelus dromedarius]|uniref:Uncharacterized protein n=1 Tax=Camelus dromedarius TaxID=9838 RepID=A0A5N4CID6_CAMDR|nr:hypothetical protein Cadr_000023456 [Camelus dromedarius]